MGTCDVYCYIVHIILEDATMLKFIVTVLVLAVVGLCYEVRVLRDELDLTIAVVQIHDKTFVQMGELDRPEEFNPFK